MRRRTTQHDEAAMFSGACPTVAAPLFTRERPVTSGARPVTNGAPRCSHLFARRD